MKYHISLHAQQSIFSRATTVNCWICWKNKKIAKKLAVCWNVNFKCMQMDFYCHGTRSPRLTQSHRIYILYGGIESSATSNSFFHQIMRAYKISTTTIKHTKCMNVHCASSTSVFCQANSAAAHRKKEKKITKITFPSVENHTFTSVSNWAACKQCTSQMPWPNRNQTIFDAEILNNTKNEKM